MKFWHRFKKSSHNSKEPVDSTQIDESKETFSSKVDYKLKTKWLNVLGYFLLHSLALEGFYVALFQTQTTTLIFTFFFYYLSGLGGTVGAHRLWCHKSFKATWHLRTILAYLNCILFIGPIYNWCRDHRCHHKYTETNADPYNAKRGLFFSHMGWLMCKKHPDVIAAGKKIDMSDIEIDPICRFQRKYYYVLTLLSCFLTPIFIPLLWGDTIWAGFWVLVILRYVLQLHACSLVNSFCNWYGRKPYDENLRATDSRLIALITAGEGFQNFHHVFPNDYASSELCRLWNLSKMFIDCMTLIGWAYDLRTVSPQVIREKKMKSGDITKRGSYGYY